MPTYNYEAKNEKGEIVKDRMDAKDKFEVAKILKTQGLNVMRVKEQSNSFWNMEQINSLLSHVNLREKIVFTRNLSSMLKAGIALSRALQIIERQSKNPKLKSVLVSLREEIEKGNNLSAGMAKFPAIFSSLFVAMVHSGEESGNLSVSLNTVGKQLEQSYELRKKIRGAMMYPSVVIIAMIIIGILMFIYVVPNLTQTFKEFNVQLPLSTRIIMGVSDFLVKYTVLTFALIISVALGVFFGLKTEVGKRASDFIALHFPIINGLVKEYNAAQTTRTLSSLFASGVSIVEALQITEGVLQNSYYKVVLKKAQDVIQKGIPLSSVFAENEKIYPVMVSEMMQVGEETGQLSEMLENIAVFYEEEVDAATKDMSTIIEPILMLFIGSAVGFFAISMIAPMYQLTASM